ncbi:hypothetical protein ACG04R_13455 [Roseateles sp. BYS78W]|uniref:Uncharacterized protein n=1 Tax=Pelomonas candidula TaxID=3299025 RepID=A0ABW7HDE7_9BURK
MLAMLVPVQSQATDEPSPQLPRPQADHASADRLYLRVRPSTVETPLFARASRSQPIRLEPRKSLIEQGIEGSREALIACQRGAYPGATVSASAVKAAGSEAQPDHCYRF